MKSLKAWTGKKCFITMEKNSDYKQNCDLTPRTPSGKSTTKVHEILSRIIRDDRKSRNVKILNLSTLVTWLRRLLQKANENTAGCTIHEVNYAVGGRKLRNWPDFTSQRKTSITL
ncbi:unnamed protein product [Caenorhabditis brenneri]